MKDIPQSDINKAREYFEGKKFSQEQVTVAGKLFKYYVLPQSLSPDLPDFAYRATNPDDGVVGVCESVPLTLRPYWAMHEIIEFKQLGVDRKGRCAEAESTVLEEVPAELKKEFTERRVNFFTALLQYAKKDIDAGKTNFSVDDLKEFEGSLHFLQSAQKLE